MTTARLVEIPGDLLPFQWHAGATWRDEDTKAETSYLAGFKTKAAALSYGKLRGYKVEDPAP